MQRFLRSLIPGLLVGMLAGAYLGWIQFPSQSRLSELPDLAQPYQDEYSVMIAAGYVSDGDALGALERLSLLEVDDVLANLREATERIIKASSRSLDDIRLLVALNERLGQLTPMMEPFRALTEGSA